ncbi:DUF481 domain-containing protein [Algoriphagus sp. SE2]|uniref:DUF481 domain-containing protein n=1 Tax=Algoriphagus sp. SE2 TaxID=3141536 RepID=UPI0031CD888C
MEFVAKKIRFFLVILLLHGFCLTLNAQNDTLRLSNEDLIVGKISYLDKGILYIKTVYSNVDIQVKWKEVSSLQTTNQFFITLENGERLVGNINSISKDSIQISVVNPSARILKVISLDEKNRFLIEKEELVLLNEINESFASRFNGDISLGFNIARSNRLRQFSVLSHLNYNGSKWGFYLTFNAIRSIQESTNAIKRYQASGAFVLFLPNDWFLIGSENLLSNTQQLIRLRANTIVGFGKYLIHTNHSYWNIQAGINNNNEDFLSDLPSNQSFEAILGTDFNFFDVGVFNFTGSWVYYKSFSEKGRNRSDASFNVRYNFVEDFFLKVGISMNYDNMPTFGASDFDYVIQSTLGWKF